MFGFFASKRDALEAFELADGLFDARSASIEFLANGFGFFLVAVSIRNDRQDAALLRGLTIGLAVITFVADHGAWLDRAEFKQGLEQGRVVSFAAGEFEADRLTLMIGLQVKLGAEPAA